MNQHQMIEQNCARWGCNKKATYDKPLCHAHWVEWEAWELDECSRCHWFYGEDAFLSPELAKDDTYRKFPLMCDECLDLTLTEEGKKRIWQTQEPEKRPLASHAAIKRPIRYVYILKLSDGKYYVGQTNDLSIRLQEHKDGQQPQTKDKDPRLVYFEPFEGMKKSVNEKEDKLTVLNKSEIGRRKLRRLIEEFRNPLRLLDLEI